MTAVSMMAPAGVTLVQEAADLARFRDASCAAVVWHREAPADALAWVAQVAPDRLPNGRVVMQAGAVSDTVRHLCAAAQMPPGPHQEWLIADIAQLAQQFATLMEAPYLRLRLQAVTTNACRKFHLDAITGRLVCTYRGTGTQYGQMTASDEAPKQIFTTPTGVPILLRGSLWPPQPQTGLLHRSPPIEGSGETRLVLVLDPIFDLEEAE